MPKKDWLRDYIITGSKCYILGFTPPPSVIYRDLPNEGDSEVDGMHRIDARLVLLRHGIDVKHTVCNFLKSLEESHGSKRAERLRFWIETGQVNAYSYRHRQELYSDRKRLKRTIHDSKYVKTTKKRTMLGDLSNKGHK